MSRGAFAGDVAVSAAGKVAFALLGAAITVLVARGLGPGGQGVFATALTLTLVLVQVGSLGVPASVSTRAARTSQSHAPLVGAVLALALAAGVVLLGVATALRAVVPAALGGLGWPETLVTLAALPVALSTLFLQSVLLGRHRARAYALVDVTAPLLTLVALGAVAAAGRLEILTVLAIISASRLAGLVVALVALRAELRSLPRPSLPLAAQLVVGGLRVALVALVVFVLIRVDLLLVNAILGPRPAGLYSIAATAAEALILLPSTVGLNLLPRAARAEDPALAAHVLRVAGPPFAALVLLAVVTVQLALPVVLGPAYDASRALFAWLAPGVLALGLLMVLSAHFSAGRYPTVLVLAWAAGLLVNVVANVLLLPVGGVVVASIAASASYVLVLVAHLAVFAREVGGLGALVPRRGDLRTLIEAVSLRGGGAGRRARRGRPWPARWGGSGRAGSRASR